LFFDGSSCGVGSGIGIVLVSPRGATFELPFPIEATGTNNQAEYRFGTPQTITTDQGSMFISEEFGEFAASMGIKLLNSSPYYAQANGQAEASNKGIIKLIKRKIEEQPKRWHTTFNEALWAYKMSCHGATKVSPYQLVYGHEAVLPWETRLGSRRVTF
jgi:transposase InsO family protein